MSHQELHYFIIAIAISYSYLLCAQLNRDEHHLVFYNGNIKEKVIHDIFPADLHISEVTYKTDIMMQEEEFLYLIDFNRGDTMSAPKMISAIETLQKKNKFSAIFLSVRYVEVGSVTINFTIHSFWTIKTIKIHGFQAKNDLSACYIMSKGDCFDKKKHQLSLLKIREFLHQNGYYNCSLRIRFDHTVTTKSVTVHIYVNRGKQCTIRSIRVNSNNKEAYKKIQQESLSRLEQKLLSQKYTKNVLLQETENLKKDLEKNGFLHIKYRLKEHVDHKNSCVDLTLILILQPKKKYLFKGNHFFSEKELLEQTIECDYSLELLPSTLLAEEIIKIYQKKGFWNASVVIQNQKKDCDLIIKEGDRVSITDIKICTTQENTTLAEECFAKLLKNRWYDDDIYSQALHTLINAYIQDGFLSCIITDSTFIKTDKDNEYTLLITVDEGYRHYFDSITIDGYPELSQKDIFKNAEKSVFSASVIEKQQEWLKSYFKNKGYPHIRISSDIKTDNNNISITWNIDKGEKIRFGKTIVTGSYTAFPFSSLLSVLPYQKGDIWNEEALQQTFKTLKDFDIFESIHIFPDYSSSSVEKPIICNLNLDDPYEIRARAGLELQHVKKYQTFNGIAYKVGATAVIRNPFFKADIIRLDFDCAQSHREIIGIYKRPFFFTSRIMGTWKVYSISYDQPGFTGSVNDLYTLVQNGMLYGLEYKTPWYKSECLFGCEGMKISIKNSFLQDDLIKAINFKPQLVDQMIPFLYIEPTLMLENLDNPINPSKGFLTLLSLKGMIPFQKKYKEALFCKILYEQSLFIPLKYAVLALRMRCGHILYRELSAIIPSERFYLGGSHSLRGYEADLAPPLGIFVDEETKEHIVPRGGRSMCNINFELRFPIIKQVGGVLFNDCGLLSSDMYADFRPENILGATGCGIRFATPFGPLRFDIGWKWRRHMHCERSYAWFLTFGQAF